LVSLKGNSTIRFSVFELDLKTGELRRNGSKIRLQEQPFQVLVSLLEHPGEVVTREELRSKLWSTDIFVDFDHSLNTAVRRLRDALGDSADTPRFVETVARRGYRFIAPVDGCHVSGGIGVAAVSVRKKPSSLHNWLGIAFLSALVIVALAWGVRRYSSRRADVIERKLTANSLENSVTSAAISPDRRYLAYADNAGIFLKVISTGDVHFMPLLQGFSPRVDDWFPDGSHLLVSRAEKPGKASLWRISVLGGSPSKLADDASGGSLSPDGTHIAFRRGALTYDGLWGREEWVMRSDGTDQVKVATDKFDESQLGRPTWSPDGKRIAYIRSNWAWNARTSSVEVSEWQKPSAVTLFSDSRLSPALHWLPDDRLIYALGSAQQQQDASLWVVSLRQSKNISSAPMRISGGHGWISHVSGSPDGKAVIFLRGNWLPSVYIAPLAADGTRVLANKRLTLDENENIPSSWTPDSRAVLFASDRNGVREIFKQAIDQPMPESLMASAEHLSQPRMTPDGSEILYISTPRSADPEAPSSIFAIPVDGGPPRLVLKDIGIWNVQCARMPSTICMYSTAKRETWRTFRFDVRSGKTADPPQNDPDCNWSLSPDGSQRAIIVFGANDGRIHLRSTSTGETHHITVRGWDGLMGADWTADGKSLLVSWHNFERDSALLHITLKGKASVLIKSTNPEIWGAIPSPDGRWLAMAEAGGPKNVWQVENF
jgi:DNA-binding winged helix-turn-helix (wHTH) protein/Tol biopolymer transport system component